MDRIQVQVQWGQRRKRNKRSQDALVPSLATSGLMVSCIETRSTVGGVKNGGGMDKIE
jgi:hypothetical protein